MTPSGNSETNGSPAVSIDVLRKIGLIVAADQQADNEKAKMLRRLARHGWIVLPGVATLAAYAVGLV
jgi:hypothetical protein